LEGYFSAYGLQSGGRVCGPLSMICLNLMNHRVRSRIYGLSVGLFGNKEDVFHAQSLL